MQQTDSDRPSGVPKTIDTGTREESGRVGFPTTRIQDGSPTAAREETRADQYSSTIDSVYRFFAPPHDNNARVHFFTNWYHSEGQSLMWVF